MVLSSQLALNNDSHQQQHGACSTAELGEVAAALPLLFLARHPNKEGPSSPPNPNKEKEACSSPNCCSISKKIQAPELLRVCYYTTGGCYCCHTDEPRVLPAMQQEIDHTIPSIAFRPNTKRDERICTRLPLLQSADPLLQSDAAASPCGFHGV